MTERHAGYIVMLEHNQREDDLQATKAAILQIRGVLSITPIVANPLAKIEAKRVRLSLIERIIDLIREDDQ